VHEPAFIELKFNSNRLVISHFIMVISIDVLDTNLFI
jgi:hypothetical protein